MRKILPFLFLLCLCLPLAAHAVSYSYEGKVVAHISQPAYVPFPIVVDKLLVNIGENVQKGQKLLQYHLEPQDARNMQYELLTEGDVQNDQNTLANLSQEIMDRSRQLRTARELSASGYGSSAEVAHLSQSLSLAQQRQANTQRKANASRNSFDLRLEELSRYFGTQLKRGDGLPAEFFLTAPIAGTVIDISPQARLNGRLNPNVPVAQVAVLNPIQIQIQVFEREVQKMRPGMPVSIELLNHEGTTMSGRISMLSMQPLDSNIVVPSFYWVYLDVDNPEHILLPGYKVRVTIDLEGK